MQPSPIATPTSIPVTPTQPVGPLQYPFEKKNMFFGLTMIKRPQDKAFARELGISWVSLQPYIFWFVLEAEPGVYTWAPVDAEVKMLQEIGIDMTMALQPANVFGESRAQLAETIEQQAETDSYDDLAGSVIAFMRDSDESKQWTLYPHDETLPMWIRFIRAAVDRYDGDGKNDMPGLKYPVRNWHFVEEFPMVEWDSSETYVEVLKPTYEAIKGEDPHALVIIPGLAGNYARYFAFADGFIQDPDAGVWKEVKYTREALASSPLLRREKEAYEYILREGRDYFDVVDIHLYEEKDTFVEGKLDWLKHKMQEYGYQKPIWCIEGGGPLKDPPGKPTRHGDPYFGEWSAKENAEFVVKLHVMSAARGVERYHWGLSGTSDTGYWNGPWTVMALMTYDRVKKPAYYTFQLMMQKLKDFESVKDISFGNTRLFEFVVGSKKVYVAWSSDNTSQVYDLSSELGKTQIDVTSIVIELQPNGNPVEPKQQQLSSTVVLLSITPVFIETPGH